jgi:transposase-like protein
MAAKAVQAKALTQRGRFWVKHLRQWLQSGQSQAQYCRQHHLSASALRWWRRQLPKEQWADSPAGVPESNQETFVELPIGQGPELCYEIRLHRGRSLRLGSRFDPDQVRQLVQVLEQPC